MCDINNCDIEIESEIENQMKKLSDNLIKQIKDAVSNGLIINAIAVGAYVESAIRKVMESEEFKIEYEKIRIINNKKLIEKGYMPGLENIVIGTYQRYESKKNKGIPKSKRLKCNWWENRG